MRRLAWVAGGLVALAAGALVLLPSLVNVEQFRGLIRGQLQQSLARDVDFGAMRLKLWPLSIALDDLRIAEAADFSTGKPFLTAKEIQVHVDLLPLLKQDVRIDDFEIVRPVLELVRDGERWNYLTLGRASNASEPTQVRLRRLAVREGTLAVSELGQPAARTLYEGLQLTLTDVAPGKTFGLTASSKLGLSFAGQGNPLRGKLTAKNVALAPLLRMPRLEGTVSGAADVESHETAVSAKGLLDLDSARFRGALVTAPPIHADFHLARDAGTIDLKAVSVRLGKAAIRLEGTWPKLRIQSEQMPFADLTRLATAFDVKIPAGVEAKGFVGADLRTEGAAATGTIRATNLELSGASLKQAVRMPDLTLEITPQAIRSRDFVAETAGARLQADFELRNYSGAAPMIEAHIRSDAASIPDLLRLARAYGVRAADSLGNARGVATVDLRISGPVQQPARLRFTGQGALKDATVRDASVDQATFDFAGETIKLTAGHLKYQEFALQNLRTTVRLLGDSQFKLDPLEADIFGGHHSGAVTIDNREKATKVRMQSKLDRMDANQIISRFTNVKQVVFGTFTADGDLAVVLDNDPARSLTGTTQIRLANGKLAGFNLLDEVAGLGKFLGWVKNREQYTSFLEIAGALKLDGGVASTDALRLRLDKALVDTSGSINLTDQTLKLKTVTTLGRALADEVGGSRIGGFLNTAFSNKAGELVIPAMVTGSLAKPKFGPDAEAMARLRVQSFEPEKAKEQVQKIFDIFRKK